jgi:hypothetical protein
MARLFRTPAEVVAERQAAGQDTEEHDTLAAANEPAVDEPVDEPDVAPADDDKPKPRRRRTTKPT